ncbi:succinate dehydrogenase assembly factor 2, partial [Corallococcus exiguus]|nr:succinate dehydrogenase assembly factor 2 [Corallococcus exiguus]
MSGTTRSSADLDVRRRQILYRSWHRGMGEMDLIMGGFADSGIEKLSDDEIAEFGQLIEV